MSGTMSSHHFMWIQNLQWPGFAPGVLTFSGAWIVFEHGRLVKKDPAISISSSAKQYQHTSQHASWKGKGS